VGFHSLGNWRLSTVALAFYFLFFLVCVRLVDVMILGPRKGYSANQMVSYETEIPRADIVDRNGNILATSIVTASAFVNTHEITDPLEVAERLPPILKECPVDELKRKLQSGKSFVWLARHLTPKRQDAIQRLGIPGIYLKKDYKRVYPHGNLASHVIGFCDIDGRGLSGVERSYERTLQQNQSQQPLRLSIDIRIQYIVANQLQESVDEFQAIGGNAILMDIKTGEIIAMESLPNLNANHPGDGKSECAFNRNTLGVNEPGSLLKILNVAIALESGKVTMQSSFDATLPVKIGKFCVTDCGRRHEVLKLRDAFIYSSNIAAIKMLQTFGGAPIQKRFFEDFGLFEKPAVELVEVGRPIFPKKWTEPTAMSSSYGYGIAISPLKLLTTINGIVNDGMLVEPTLIYGKQQMRQKIISSETSSRVRDLMRETAIYGTARSANRYAADFRIFGKTGTTYKNAKGMGYSIAGKRRRITSFVAGFPHENPRYILLVMLDEPKATPQTCGQATASWNAAPCGGKIIARIAPLLGIPAAEA
jgi:cell division protein FtsI (penicillin-binding protein 3)